MQLKEVRIANYRNFAEFTATLENFSVIIGVNNAGKTNFLQALELVFAPTAPRNVVVQKQDFRDPARPIVIEVVIGNLTEHDKAAFFHDEGLIDALVNTITIRFESVWSPVEQDVWNECYFVRDDLPNGAQRITDFSQRFKQQVPFFVIPPSRSASQEMSLSSRRDFGRIMRLFAGDYLRPLETLRQEVVSKLRNMQKEKDNFEDFPEDAFVSVKDKIENLLSIVQDSVVKSIADRGIEAILADLGDFHDGWETRCKDLLTPPELEPGSPLAEQLESLLEKATILANRCTAQVALSNLRDSMANAQQFERLSTEFDAVFSEVMPSQHVGLSLFPIQDDELISQVSVDIDDFPLLEHGSGYQSIFVVGLKLMRTLSQLVLAEGIDVHNFVLAVEEPEVHLHPHMQRHLMNGLRRLQRLWKKKDYHLQVIVTTHSPSVVSRVSPHELITFQRQGGETKAVKWHENELQLIAKEIESDDAKVGKKYAQLSLYFAV